MPFPGTDPWAGAKAALLQILNRGQSAVVPPGGSAPPGASTGLAAAQGTAYGQGTGSSSSDRYVQGQPYFGNYPNAGAVTLGTTDNQGGGVYGSGTFGPNDAAALAAGFLPGSVPNAGQTDLFGNTYYPVDNSLWNGQYIDPHGGLLPSHSTGPNAQLWGGSDSDGPPRWLQQIVNDTMAMPDGAEKTARIHHIMSSIIDPKSGANQHDLGYVERSFGISQ